MFQGSNMALKRLLLLSALLVGCTDNEQQTKQNKMKRYQLKLKEIQRLSNYQMQVKKL